MARPVKNNADYFSHDADMRNDVKIKAIRRRFGHTGYSLWNMILEHLTDSDDFRFTYDEVTQELLAADFDVSPDQLSEIIDYMVKLNLLQKSKGVISCENLTHRFSPLISKRERDRKRITKKSPENGDSGSIEKDDQKVFASDNRAKREVIDDENRVSGSENLVSDSDNPHSIGKESKVKESKGKKSKKSDKPDKQAGKKNDLMDAVIEAFCESHGDYEIVVRGKERAAAKKLYDLYLRHYPDAHSGEVIAGLRAFFDECMAIPQNEWLRQNISLPLIVSKFNEYKQLLKYGQHGKQKELADIRAKASGRIAEQIRAKYGDTSP